MNSPKSGTSLLPIILSAVSIIILAAIAFFSWRALNPPPELPVLKAVPPFQFTERSEEQIDLAALRGNVWIANFIFTRCLGPCPLLSEKMSDLQAELADAADVKLLSFSVDPEYDQPAVLADYARKYAAQEDKWYFLTGRKDILLPFIRENLNLSVVEATASSEIIHTTRFMLVDKSGNIRGYFISDEPDFKARLLAAVAQLREES